MAMRASQAMAFALRLAVKHHRDAESVIIIWTEQQVLRRGCFGGVADSQQHDSGQ
jgi:hypothetical protein